jgi:cytoskeleton protein RodZ
VSDSESLDDGVIEAPGPGTQLRQAREARGMTVAEVAASIKMSPRQIEAIENGDFSRLSGATFIRGFIRNYARVLKIDAMPLLASLDAKAELAPVELTVSAGSGVRMPSGNERHGKGSIAAAVAAMTLLVVALVLYFDVVDIGVLLRWYGDTPKAAVPKKAAPALVQPVIQPLPDPLPTAAPDAAAPSGPPEGPVLKPGARRLVFSFDANSWVEVRDGSSRIIFSQLSPKGTTQVVEGTPPFQLVVGSAASVRLVYDDRPVDLRPYTRVEVARLTLE